VRIHRAFRSAALQAALIPALIFSASALALFSSL
jgi:hypothetical protein